MKKVNTKILASFLNIRYPFTADALWETPGFVHRLHCKHSFFYLWINTPGAVSQHCYTKGKIFTFSLMYGEKNNDNYTSNSQIWLLFKQTHRAYLKKQNSLKSWKLNIHSSWYVLWVNLWFSFNKHQCEYTIMHNLSNQVFRLST